MSGSAHSLPEPSVLILIIFGVFTTLYLFVRVYHKKAKKVM